MDVVTTLIAISLALTVMLLGFVMLRARIKVAESRITELQERLDRNERDLAQVERRLTAQIRQNSEQGQQQKTLARDLEQRLDQLNQVMRTQVQNHDSLAKKVDALGTATPAPETPSVEENSQDLIASDLAQRVLTQLRAGETPAEIARREGVQVGEIMLIKSLFSSKAT